MKKLSSRSKILILKALNDCFSGNSIELDKYMINNVEKLIDASNVNISTDDFVENLCDNMSEAYEDFAGSVAENLLTIIKTRSKIRVTYVAPFYYIENTVFGMNASNGYRETYMSKFSEISVKEGLCKGGFFEQFCTLFLIDIGIEVIKTTPSGDDGIDIYGKVKRKSSNEFINILFGEDICLLAQVKFYSSKVDASVIRKLIGDSLFYRFNSYDDSLFIGNSPLYLMVFSNTGFYKKAEEFAKRFKVATIDSNEMIDILCNMPDTHNLESIKYLMNYVI